MVGIVIVSHSANLAAGVQELAQQMTPEVQVPIAVAGGVDDPEHPIGTDAVRVFEAITAVYNEDGVLVLMDLGSALLSAETAVELLTPAQQHKIRLCAAPLVEGTLSAVVQAAVGGSLEQVYREAMSALTAKESQLSGFEVAGSDSGASPVAPDALELTLVVQNRLGLHARPAARFVSVANQFAAEVNVTKAGNTANAKSINQVATLGVRQGDEILVRAAGTDAAAALAALQALAADHFGEKDEDVQVISAPRPVAPLAEGELGGIAASPGIAIGPAALYRPQLPDVVKRSVTDVETERARLQAAIAAAKVEIEAVHKQAVQQVGKADAAIFEAHLLILQDPAVLAEAHSTISLQKINAEAAWQQVMTTTAESYRAMADPYMQARAVDVLDVAQRVLGQMMDVERPSLDVAQPSILVASDLTPSDTARLNPDQVLGICTELGGATAHSAILARALGIPAVVGVGSALVGLSDGQELALDGGTGRIWIDPDYDTLQDLNARQQVWVGEQLRAKAAGQEAAVTQDGHRIEVAANIGGPNDTPVALEYGAEGVGLFRTEFMFLGRETAPTEEEQYQAYTRVVKAMGKRPLIVRTLDVGGDKPLPYFEADPEMNPFLGWRGIRFSLDHPDIFNTQLRAILRASMDAKGRPAQVKIMFPMIGALPELRTAKAMLRAVQASLRGAGVAFNEQIELGIMIEVPSAVAIADQLAAEVDFFSIGTNDLAQYTMAADRGNARVANLADALQPAVLRLVQQTVKAGHDAGIWVGMCGELAGNALATPLLVGLGLDELSMSAPSIPAVKEAIRRLTIEETEQVAAKVLEMESAAAIQEYLASL